MMGISTAARTACTWASATARTAGPETPPVPAPSHGSPLRGSKDIPRIVLISDTALAPALCAAVATAATSLAFGVSLTISGFSVNGRTRWSSADTSHGSAPMTRPVSTFGQETFSSSAATSWRSANALTSSATSSRVKPMTLTIKGTGRRARSSAR